MKTSFFRNALAKLLLGFGLLGTSYADAPVEKPFFGLDDNGNKISDIYEALFSAVGQAEADDDGDGISNSGEAVAGTNFADAGDRFDFVDVEQTPGLITGRWKTLPGKQYQLQATADLGAGWINEGSPISGTGGQVAGACPTAGQRMFLRIQVVDIDSDGDGVNDWEESMVGSDHNLWDTDGDGRDDKEVIRGMLTANNVVNIYSTTSWTSEGSAKTAKFTVVRRGAFQPITIPFALAGSATNISDFTLSNTTGQIVLPAGVMSATISVTALNDAVAEDSETVQLTLESGAGYVLGSATTASVTIISQGLVGQYFDTSNTTYTNTANFDPAQLKLTRRDATIDFDWLAGTPSPLIANDDSYSIRWSGFIIPKYSELYSVHAYADRGVYVYCSATPITAATTPRILQWSTTSPTTKNTANMLASSALMVAGQPYYIQVDFRDSSTFTNNANIQIRWSSASQAEEVIPATALSSEGFIGKEPIISSSLITLGLTGAPFGYAITASNTPTSFSADGLPPGVTLNPTSGLLSSISLSAVPGVYFPTIVAANAAGADVKNLVIVVVGATGNATRQVWSPPGGLAGSGVDSVPVWEEPSTTTPIASLQAPADVGENFGDRLHGYITAPMSGNYQFLVTADENAELWISSSKEPNQRLKRSWVKNGNLVPGDWEGQPNQRSFHMRMKAGDQYYFEAIRREATGNDHFSVAWILPGSTTPEVIPAYALSPYQASTATTTDTIYVANLTPQAGAVTLGSGSGVLRVNEARTQAILTFNFANLTGPIISQHIHDGLPAPGGGAIGAIVFDIDDVAPNLAGERLWTITRTGLHEVSDIIASIESGNSYLNLHTSAYPNGEIKGFFRKVVGSRTFTPPPAPPAAELTLPTDPIARKREAVRFLQQAGFGARHDADGVAPWDPDSIEAVQDLGYAAWLDAQLGLSPGPAPDTVVLQTLPPRIHYIAPDATRRTLIPSGTTTGYNGSGVLANFVKDYYSKFPLSGVGTTGAPLESSEEIWRAWWKTMTKAPDQLRHRVAFALSQIMVVSEDGELDEQARAMVNYHDLLYYYGMGNFRTLLEKVTLNPAMGRYLDMLGNKKPNLTTGYIPNENFAREIMQLFSIGLRRMHPDGSLALSEFYSPVETYQQANVVGLSHVFTGWTYPGTSSDLITPMIPKTPSDHDIGEKLLLDATVVPATSAATTNSCNAEFAVALDVIFHHPNTGPFICRQLIQRLVTANPTQGYIYRTASVFSDNGSGVRGDMTAVVKAILLDPEARNLTARQEPTFGHIKEPVIRAIQLLRALKGFSYGEVNYGSTKMLGMVTVSPNTNVDLSVPLPTTDYSAVGTTALFSGNVVVLSNQNPSSENGTYIFNGVGVPMTLWTGVPSDAPGYASRVTYSTDLAPTVTASNLTLPLIPYAVVEGIPLRAGSLLLLRNQTNPAENGVYELTSLTAPLVRAAKADEATELEFAAVTVAAYDDPATPTVSYANKTFIETAAIATMGVSPIVYGDGSATNSGQRAWQIGSTGGTSFQQTPLRATTVFNFFEPDYVFLGDSGNAGLVSPEFQITSESSVVNTANWFYEFTRRNSSSTSSPHSYGQGFAYSDPIKRDIKLDLTYERSLATAGNAGALIDHLADLLMPGQLTPSLRTVLVNHINSLTPTSNTDPDRFQRVAEALYFLTMTPEFALQN